MKRTTFYLQTENQYLYFWKVSCATFQTELDKFFKVTRTLVQGKSFFHLFGQLKLGSLSRLELFLSKMYTWSDFSNFLFAVITLLQLSSTNLETKWHLVKKKLIPILTIFADCYNKISNQARCMNVIRTIEF